jgi:hypothetical protein
VQNVEMVRLYERRALVQNPDKPSSTIIGTLTALANSVGFVLLPQ